MPNDNQMHVGDQLQRLEMRVRDLEHSHTDIRKWRHQRDIEEARETERAAARRKEFDELHKRLDRIDGHFNRVVVIVITGVTGAVLTFILRGGLNIATG